MKSISAIELQSQSSVKNPLAKSIRWMLCALVVLTISTLGPSLATAGCLEYFSSKAPPAESSKTDPELRALAKKALNDKTRLDVEKPYESREEEYKDQPNLYEVGHFFDAKGQLNPDSFNHAQLAVENGRVPISTLRLHLPSADRNPMAKDVRAMEKLRLKQFGLFLSDLVPLLEKQKEIKLHLIYPKGARKRAYELVASILGEATAKSRVTFTEHPERFYELDPWAQDDAKPLASGALLAPGYDVLKQQSASFIENTLNTLEKSGYQMVRSNVQFDGGNLVVGERHVFVGIDVVSAVARRLNVPLVKALKAFEYEFDKPVIPVGEITKGEYPGGTRTNFIDFHSDMILSVGVDQRTQKEVVFLASADAAVKVYKKALKEIAEGRRNVSAEEKENLMRELKIADFALRTDYSARARHNAQMKKRLEAAGYEVREVPSLRINAGLTTPLNMPAYLNYVNVVLSENLAVVPQLGLPILDQAAHAVYEAAGYEVIGAKNSSVLYLQAKGGPHCALSIMRALP